VNEKAMFHWGGGAVASNKKNIFNEGSCVDGLTTYFKSYSRGVQPAARQVVLCDPWSHF
jgi:hypothetical protein